ncbi:unnamed protein product, partial [Soboliphyme baturini]|uniref:Bromo domain-containing protein n=1 Tax=Soboliphyme baturini TaxID=241478 RepID=A0A183IU52_9BILA
MNRGLSRKNFEPGYKLLKWAFLDEFLALRVSTWSGTVTSGRALAVDKMSDFNESLESPEIFTMKYCTWFEYSLDKLRNSPNSGLNDVEFQDKVDELKVSLQHTCLLMSLKLESKEICMALIDISSNISDEKCPKRSKSSASVTYTNTDNAPYTTEVVDDAPRTNVDPLRAFEKSGRVISMISGAGSCDKALPNEVDQIEQSETVEYENPDDLTDVKTDDLILTNCVPKVILTRIDTGSIASMIGERATNDKTALATSDTVLRKKALQEKVDRVEPNRTVESEKLSGLHDVERNAISYTEASPVIILSKINADGKISMTGTVEENDSYVSATSDAVSKSNALMCGIDLVEQNETLECEIPNVLSGTEMNDFDMEDVSPCSVLAGIGISYKNSTTERDKTKNGRSASLSSGTVSCENALHDEIGLIEQKTVDCERLSYLSDIKVKDLAFVRASPRVVLARIDPSDNSSMGKEMTKDDEVVSVTSDVVSCNISVRDGIDQVEQKKEIVKSEKLSCNRDTEVNDFSSTKAAPELILVRIDISNQVSTTDGKMARNVKEISVTSDSASNDKTLHDGIEQIERSRAMECETLTDFSDIANASPKPILTTVDTLKNITTEGEESKNEKRVSGTCDAASYGDRLPDHVQQNQVMEYDRPRCSLNVETNDLPLADASPKLNLARIDIDDKVSKTEEDKENNRQGFPRTSDAEFNDKTLLDGADQMEQSETMECAKGNNLLGVEIKDFAFADSIPKPVLTVTNNSVKVSTVEYPPNIEADVQRERSDISRNDTKFDASFIRQTSEKQLKSDDHLTGKIDKKVDDAVFISKSKGLALSKMGLSSEAQQAQCEQDDDAKVTNLGRNNADCELAPVLQSLIPAHPVPVSTTNKITEEDRRHSEIDKLIDESALVKENRRFKPRGLSISPRKFDNATVDFDATLQGMERRSSIKISDFVNKVKIDKSVLMKSTFPVEKIFKQELQSREAIIREIAVVSNGDLGVKLSKNCSESFKTSKYLECKATTRRTNAAKAKDVIASHIEQAVDTQKRKFSNEQMKTATPDPE